MFLVIWRVSGVRKLKEVVVTDKERAASDLSSSVPLYEEDEVDEDVSLPTTQPSAAPSVPPVKIVQGTLRYLLDLLMNGIGLGKAISNTLAPFSPRSASEDNTRISKMTQDVQRDSDN
ncbi:hypothetical protein GGU11DRAFT_751447 [Lentinula aff. detonsa]|nr:hypothetical protein GGU11DRAFT_751447 [Lentinula aff. detonsa]